MLRSREEVSEALIAIETERSRHTQRTFYDHLIGTGDILVRWGCPWELCLAGYFHATYGTEGTAHLKVPLTPDHREPLIQLIGDRAERIVYLFCCAERREDMHLQLRAPGSRHELRNRWTQQLIPTDELTLRELVTLLNANLLEEYPRFFRARWRSYLAKLGLRRSMRATWDFIPPSRAE